MKKLIILFGIYLLAFSNQDTKNFIKWVNNPKSNFNVIDYFIKNDQINLQFPSLTTKTANNKFKIIVLKKRPIQYELKIFSYDLNKSIDFKKELIFKSSSFDVYNILIPYEYKNLRFQCDYQIKKCNLFNYCNTENREDNSTDNFSVKPYKIYTNDKDTNNFHIIVDDGKSLYTAKGSGKNYTYAFEKGKGVVTFWYSDTSRYFFCLDNNWTYVDEDDTPENQRQMPCIELILPPIDSYWGGFDTNYTKKKPLNFKIKKNIFINKIMW